QPGLGRHAHSRGRSRRCRLRRSAYTRSLPAAGRASAWVLGARSRPGAKVSMSLKAVFLEDILAAPDDDVPRLICADWLEDNGDPARAEFIRLQIDLSRMNANEPRHASVKERERELLNEHEGRWAQEVLRRGVMFVRFARGFIEGAILHA